MPWGYYKASRRRYKTSNRDQMTAKQVSVESQLRMAELQAFGGLIFGPLLGAFLLNYVRGTMARPANGLITNFNITVFILAAELRPLRIAYDYLTNRSDALQQELTEVSPARYEELEKQIQDLVSRIPEAQRQSPGRRGSTALTNGVHTVSEDSELQQIKYALKKFEKYEANNKYEFETKLYALERKLADLGARAETVTSTNFSLKRLLSSLLLLPARLVYKTITMPIHASEVLISSTRRKVYQ